MTAERKQKQPAGPGEDKPPLNHSPQPQGRWPELLGLVKLFERLPLHKLSARMAYCMFFDLVLLVFVLVLWTTDKQVNSFPNAWDLRFIVATTIVVFFVGIWDMWSGGRK